MYRLLFYLFSFIFLFFNFNVLYADDIPPVIVIKNGGSNSGFVRIRFVGNTDGDFGGDSYCETELGEGWEVANLYDILKYINVSRGQANSQHSGQEFPKAWFTYNVNVSNCTSNCDNWSSNDYNRYGAYLIDLSENQHNHLKRFRYDNEGHCSGSHPILCKKSFSYFDAKLTGKVQGDFGGDSYCKSQFGEGYKVASTYDAYTIFATTCIKGVASEQETRNKIDSYFENVWVGTGCRDSVGFFGPNKPWQTNEFSDHGMYLNISPGGKRLPPVKIRNDGLCSDRKNVLCVKYE